MSRKNHKMVNESLIKTDKSFSDLKLSLKERISDWLFEEYYSLFKSNGYKYSKDFDDEIPFKCLCKDRACKILPVREASLSKTCE